MLFVIIGLQNRKARLDEPARACPRCGYHELFAERWDRYFSLFFIPLFRVKRGIQVFSCKHCGSVFNEKWMPLESQVEERVFTRAARKCPDCGRPLEEDFGFCPGCGNKIRRS